MKNLVVAMRKQEREIASLRSTIVRFTHDVDKLITNTEPAKWPEEVLKLYEVYVKDSIHRGKIGGPGKNTIAEFNRQRRFMERSVRALKKEAAKADDVVARVKRKTVDENTLLIGELNTLRKTVKQLQGELSQLKSEKRAMKAKLGSGRVTDNGRTLPRRTAFAATDLDSNGSPPPDYTDTAESAVLDEVEGAQVSDSDPLAVTAPELEGRAAQARSSALQQLSASYSSLSRASSAPSHGRSALVGTVPFSRPKTGGRPLSALERRKRLARGSLAKGLQSMRQSQSEQRLSSTMRKLEQSEASGRAKSLQIDHLRTQLSMSLSRAEKLEQALVDKGPIRLDVGGRVRPRPKKRPASSPQVRRGCHPLFLACESRIEELFSNRIS